jgi:hypothetical protein
MRESIQKIKQNGRDELVATYRLVVTADEIANALLPDAQEEFSEDLKLLKNMMGDQILFVAIVEASSESQDIDGRGIALNIGVRTKMGLAVDRGAPRYIHEKAEDETFFDCFSEGFMETLSSLGRVYFEQAEKKDFAREYILRCHPEVAHKVLGEKLDRDLNINSIDTLETNNISTSASLGLIEFLQQLISDMPGDHPERVQTIEKLEELKKGLPLLGEKPGSTSIN